MKKRKGGFTLVELIVVIVIILILAAVLVPSLMKYVTKAKKANAITECKEVVQASHRVAVDLAADEVLTSETLNAKKPTILKEADAGGEFESVIEFEEETTEILSFEYLSKSGLHVIYDIHHKPQVYIEEGDPTLTKVNNYIKSASDYMAEYKAEHGGKVNYWDRQWFSEYMLKHGGFLEVSESQMQGVSDTFNQKTLYWHPYNLGSANVENPPIILFANENASNHGGWRSNLVYVDGHIYEAPKKDSSINKLGESSSTGGFQDTVTDYESLKKWLDEQGYKPIN